MVLSYIRAAMFTINTFVVAIIYSLVLIPLYPLKFIIPSLYITIESFLYSKAGEALVPVFAAFPEISLYSDTLDALQDISRKRAIVMCNHQDSGDVPVMMTLVAYFNISHSCTWILDRMFKWTQFGVCAQWHNDFFSAEGRDTRDSITENLRRHFSTTYFDRGHKWLVMFPEGGYLKNRGESSRRYAEANNLPVLHNCILPRATAFVNIVNAMRGDVIAIPETVEDIVDVTLAFAGAPNDLCLSDVILGRYTKHHVYINFRTYKMEDLPRSNEDLTTWLYDRYVEKEQLLANFQSTGTFTEDTEFTRLKLPQSRLLGSLIFWYITAFFVWDLYRGIFRTALSLGFRLLS